jgi:hypothetical protein
MPSSVLVTTAGLATSNAYVTLAVANQYHADRPAVGTTWAAATDDQRTAAILWATQLLDRLYVWSGWTVDSVQVLQWPRWGMLRPTGWTYVAQTEIPVQLQYATAEYARQLLASDRAGDSDVETQGITSVKAGSVQVNFKLSVFAKVVPDAVFHLLPRSWGYPRSRSAGVRELQRA